MSLTKLISTIQPKVQVYSRTVVDDESLVAGGHQVAGLPVGSVTDLCRNVSPRPTLQRLHDGTIGCGDADVSCAVCRVVKAVRTLGIAAWPLNRLRTRLSIPLGLRHEGSTPVPSQRPSLSFQFLVHHTFEAVGLVAVEALGVCIGCVSAKFANWVRGFSIRFLTIATCFLAAAICCNQY